MLALMVQDRGHDRSGYLRVRREVVHRSAPHFLQVGLGHRRSSRFVAAGRDGPLLVALPIEQILLVLKYPLSITKHLN